MGESSDPAARLPAARHWGGFALSGAIAFCIDAGVMEFGVRVLGLPTLVARLIAIASAMVGAWIAHRNLTFAVQEAPGLVEFARFVAAASTSAAINYAGFAAILLTWPEFPRLAALVLSSTVATIFSYISMRYAVFRKSAS